MNRLNSSILTIFLLLFSIQMIAQESIHQTGTSKNKAKVMQIGDVFEVYAQGERSGLSLIAAKEAAISDILSQLEGKRFGMSYSECHYQSSNEIIENGIDEFVADTYVKGHWKLMDGIYQYTLELFLKSPEKTEKAETP